MEDFIFTMFIFLLIGALAKLLHLGTGQESFEVSKNTIQISLAIQCGLAYWAYTLLY